MALEQNVGLLNDTTFWVLIASAIFAYIGYRFGRSTVVKALDDRTEKIRTDLETAEKIRIEAQDLLAEYQHKQRDALKEAKEILGTAQKQADQIQQQAKENLKVSLDRRKKQAQEKIRQAEEKAINDIQNKIVDISTAAASDILQKHNEGKAGDQLIEGSIDMLKKIKKLY